MVILLLFTGGRIAYCQRLYSANAESKTLQDGKYAKINRQIYYRTGGNLNILYSNPSGEEYYSSTSPFGLTTFYYPATKESVTLGRDFFSADDELLCLFAGGGAEDLGLQRFGYLLKSSSKDGKYTVRRYEPREKGGRCARVELVLDESYLPVYCAYFDAKDKLLTKTYYSGYTFVKDFVFPQRVTEISYFGAKRDSTVRLDIYSRIKVDEPSPMFDFRVPSDAVSVDMKKGLEALVKKRP